MACTLPNITQQVAHVVNKIMFLEKRRVVRTGDVELYPSEVHLLLLIKEDRDTNATEIARQLGLTKGAISQTLSRLERKGMIHKSRDSHKKNELNLSLTRSGAQAYRRCQQGKTAFLKAHESYLRKLNPSQREAVYGFLQHMESVLDGFGSDE